MTLLGFIIIIIIYRPNPQLMVLASFWLRMACQDSKKVANSKRSASKLRYGFVSRFENMTLLPWLYSYIITGVKKSLVLEPGTS